MVLNRAFSKMDLSQLFYSCIFTLVLYLEGVVSSQVQESVSPNIPVLGSVGFVLRCDVSLDSTEVAQGKVLQGIKLFRKRSTDTDFVEIVSFPAPAFNLNYTLLDNSLTTRTDIKQPNSDASTFASVTFTNTECNDIAEYKWSVTYYFNTVQPPVERTSDVKVQVHGSITEASDFGVTASTGYNVMEGTNVTFTCKAHVGAEPQGQLLWSTIIGNPGNPQDISNQAVKGALVPYETCSYTQVSTLQLTMSQSYNGVLVRCTLQQNGVTIDPNHNQTSNFNVSYSARQTSVMASPFYPVYSEGEPAVTLSCSAVANPAASYSWVLPDGSVFDGRSYQLQNLQINDTGNYTCYARNGIPNENHTDSSMYRLEVVEKTTPTTTSTTSTTPGATQKPTTAPSTGGDDDDQTTIIIIVVCVVAGVIIIVIIVICVWRKMRKPQKFIEEPPEKPRNNQDLTFAGYRPGLTTSNDSLKNSGNNLNTSFNSFDSTDSKPRNEDGLMYVDLQFDDKPRSRRPIQVYDNGTATQYADIAMPRV